MENHTEVNSSQSQNAKNFHSKLLIRIICVVLSVTMVALICCGTALFVSYDMIADLTSSLSNSNKKIEALNTENARAYTEINSLRHSQTLTAQEIEQLTQEYSKVSNALTQSKEESKRHEDRVNAMDSINKELQDQMNQLKLNAENAKQELEQMKIDAEKAMEELEALKQQLEDSDDKIRIYIDQGHNPEPYHNSGAQGNGLYEQEITFLIGCLLADLLRKDGRFVVQLSRPNKSVVLGTDNKSSLMARVNGAAEFNADYLISLHTNSFTQDTANGIEVYVANETSESYSFGKTLLEGMIESTNLRNRGMKTNGDLDILEFSTMPAALLEMGFISNSTDAALLSEHPELFANGIYNGILEYFGFQPNNQTTF